MKKDPTLFDRYDVVSSPSQMVDYLDCPRRWWFRRVARLPVLKEEDKFTFGNVLHAVIQRWLEADNNGRDGAGNVADLYPEGWDESVNKREAALVKMLVKSAIDSGLIRRTPGRVIEQEFEIELVPGVGAVGALDVKTREGVEDHKSTKASKWCSSEDELANDPKMLMYAKIWLDEKESADAEQLKLRLNYMGKDPKKPFTRAVEVLVSREDVESFWEETIVPAAEGMLALKKARSPATEWQKITGPQDPGVCKKYGGCNFAGICARMKTPDAYAKEINRANGVIDSKPVTTLPKRTPGMSIFGKKKSAPAPVEEIEEIIEVEETEVEEVEVEPMMEVELLAPPWANPKCLACKGSGISVKKGRSCMACDSVSGRKGGITSEAYELLFDDEGGVTWKALNGDEEEVRVEITPKPKVDKPKAAVKKPKVDKKPAPKPEVEIVEETEVEVEEIPLVRETPATGGFRLFINAIPIVSDRKTIDLAHVLQNEGAELAEAKGADSFYLLDAFKRRDMLASQASIVSKGFDGCDVFCVGGNQDLKDYTQAMRQFAAEVVVGVF